MEITGLAGGKKADAYLASRYHLTRIGDVAGLPVYQAPSGEYHVGGYKVAYSIILDGAEDIVKALDEWQKDKKHVRYAFSTRRNLFRSKRHDLILELPQHARLEDRFDWYARNVRKHIRRVSESSLEYRIGPSCEGWYVLYTEHCARMGSTPRPQEWFHSLESSFQKEITVVTAHDEGRLVGALYCLHEANYLALLFITSKVEYWDKRINNGLYDMAVCFAIEQGIRYVDFGPTMQSDASHENIKVGFGAQPFYFSDQSFDPIFSRLWSMLGTLAFRIHRKGKLLLKKSVGYLRMNV